MKKILTILMSVLLTLSVSMVNVFAEDEFGPTKDFPYVVHYHCSQGGSIEITSPTVDTENIFVDNEDVTVRFPDTTGDVVFTYTESEGNSLDGIWIEQDGNDDDTRFVDLESDTRHNPTEKTFTINLAQDKYDDPEITGFKFVNMDFNFRGEDDFGPTSDFPYVINWSCGGEGTIIITSPDSIAEENISVNEGGTRVRFPNTVESVVFGYNANEGNVIDGIWIEQDGNDDDTRFVDLESDTRHNPTEKTFTINLAQDKYDDPEITGFKFVNMNFSFRPEGGEEPSLLENQYRIFYSGTGYVADITSGDVKEFTEEQAITWVLTYPQDVENLYRVEINVLVDGGAHYEYEYGREEGNSEEIVVNDTEKTISYTPTTNNPFEVFIYWTPENFFDSFGYNDREEFQICADIISNDGEITYSEERRGGVRIDGENGYREKNNFAVQGQETEVENITLTIVPLNGKELKSFKVDGDEKDISKLSKNNDGLYEYIIAVDDLKEAIVDTSPTEYRYKSVYVEADFGNEEEPIPDNYYGVRFPNNTEIEGNVVTYSVQKDDDVFRDVTITIAGAEVDSINHRVLIPKDDLDSVTFTINYDDFGQKYKTDWDKFVRNFDLRISESNVSLPLTNRKTSLATISSDIDLPDVLNLEVTYYKFPWYTISYGNSGNVQTEHGSVLVERIHCGENTFTNIDDEVNEGNKIYPMSMLIGGNADVESQDYDPENDTLAKYKLAYGTGDIFVELGTGDVLIDYKFVPEYGYQVTDIALNESDSILGDFDPNASTISEFTFTTEMNGNVHFLVKFEKTEDLADVDKATNITGASIANGANATKTGNLALTIEDDETDTAIENAISTFDVTLDNVVSKGGENGIWTTNITEFDDPITVNLKLDTSEYDGDNYTVVREHDGFKEVLSGTTYNAKTGELTFQTNKFSKYTIVEIPKPNHGSGSSKYVIPKTGIR